MKNQHNKRIKILRLNRRGEYTSNKFTKLCENYVIIYKVTASYSPKSNDVVERNNRAILDIVESDCFLLTLIF